MSNEEEWEEWEESTQNSGDDSDGDGDSSWRGDDDEEEVDDSAGSDVDKSKEETGRQRSANAAAGGGGPEGRKPKYIESRSKRLMPQSGHITCLIHSYIIQPITCDRRPLLVKAPRRPSTFRGVSWNNDRWSALIEANRQTQSIGIYGTEEEAARAYDEKAKQLRANLILNFLPDGSLNPDRKPTYVELRRKRSIDVSDASQFLFDHL